MNEFRRDPITGRWVIISSLRDSRPNHFRAAAQVDTDDGSLACPFCAHQLDTPPIVARYGPSIGMPWQVCVVPNLYPVVHPESDYRFSSDENGLFEVATDCGFHEVVIESPTHVTQASELSTEQFVWMLQAYRDRMRVMRDAGMVFALPMKNLGANAGASLKHSHSQMFGLPMVPAQVLEELEFAAGFADKRKRCVFCSLIAAESAAESRVLLETDDFVAWCPHASRFGFETWIAPRRHRARFEAEADQSLEKLGAVFRLILQNIEQHPRIDAFNYLIHSLPFDTDRDDHYHWHIEIIPRIAKTAAFELGTGVHINTVTPEQAASELRIGLA